MSRPVTRSSLAARAACRATPATRPTPPHWGVVRCSNGLSLEIPSTVENGMSYGVGAVATSRNPGR